MEEKFKYIVGEAKQDNIATIRFFDSVNEYSSSVFISEFLWLESQNPSKIRICLNSEGGSVLYGMSMYSVIQNSSIPTECIIEGLAASMASVIWAAGDQSLMKDYGILMIHNPFSTQNDEDDNDAVKAFRQQIETIYVKRFGLTKTKARSIMNGEEGKDGTFLTAEQAVAEGIIPESNVIKTSKQKTDRVKNAIEGIHDNIMLRDTITSIYNEISVDELKIAQNKLSDDVNANLNKINKVDNKTKTDNMEEKDKTLDFHFGAVIASLGFTEKVDVSQVMNRINELIGVEAQLKEVQNELETLKVEKAGEEAKNVNLTKELQDVKDELKTYKDAEEVALKSKITNLVENAIKAGKIEDSAKESWIEMAENNFDLVKNVLNSIPEREKISDKINNNEDNVKDVKDSVKNTMDEVKAQVDEVVGKDFKFKKFDE